MRAPRLVGAALACAVLIPVAFAQVTVIEPGHTAIQWVDSSVPLHPSQAMLDMLTPAMIESIAVDPSNGELYVQVNAFTTTNVFKVTGGIVSPVALDTGLIIDGRGSDMHFDPATNALLVQDRPLAGPSRIASIDIGLGTVSTYSLVTAPVFSGGTFGMQFSKGAGMSDVPAGDIVFTSDVAAGGIHSVTSGGGGSTNHVPITAFPSGGDDLIIQPNGDWVWVGDLDAPITSISPIAPHPTTPSLLDIQTIFNDAGLFFGFGTRATACDSTGAFYISFSATGGSAGGTGIFRIDAAITTATLVVTIGQPNSQEGLQDLMTGPSSGGAGTSLYFTVHDVTSDGKEVWELTLPECPQAECFLVIGNEPGSVTFDAGGHTWQTQLGDVSDYYPVTMEQGPSFVVPDPIALPNLPLSPLLSRLVSPIQQLHAQVLMWNPEHFPSNPEQSSNGLTITVWSNGTASASPFGAQDGMVVWLEVFEGRDGRPRYRLPFGIDW